jgi:hypothetical protein
MTPQKIRKMLEEYQSSRLDSRTDAQIQQNSERASLGGSKAQKTLKKEKKGFYGFSKEKRSENGKRGAEESNPKMIQWCRENNHWEKLAILQKGVPKSEEVKKKISKSLKGKPLTEETKKKMSESRMGHGWSEETIDKLKKSARKRMRPVMQYDLDGNFIKEWGGFAEIVDELGLQKSGIYACCNNKINKSQGFIWKYK